MSTDESILEGIQDAIAAYHRGEGNIRDLIAFIARETFSCQLYAAFSDESPDAEALSFFVTFNSKITELFEEILLSHESEDKIPAVIEQLKLQGTVHALVACELPKGRILTRRSDRI